MASAELTLMKLKFFISHKNNQISAALSYLPKSGSEPVETFFSAEKQSAFMVRNSMFELTNRKIISMLEDLSKAF